MKNFLAKSKKTFDSDLLNHTKMVINIGLYLGKKVYVNVLGNRKWTEDMFLNKLSLALALHDIGKCTTLTQSYYNNTKKNEKKIYEMPSHNILSWAFIKSYLGLNNKIDTPITKGVLHHHVINNNNLSDTNNTQNYLWYKYLTDGERIDFINFYNEIIEFLNKEHNITHNIIPLNEEKADIRINEEHIYQNIDLMTDTYDDILLDTTTSLIRACVILADRAVSSISETNSNDANLILNNNKEFFQNYYYNLLNSNNVKGVDISTRGYDMERLVLQTNVVKTIENHNHTVITASAGFGKTLIGLMYFLKHHQKITWVVPRNVIARGTYKSVIQELNKIGETNVKVALFCTGDVLESSHNDITSDNLEDCDIIITNIDSLLNRNIKNNMTKMLLQAYTGTVIFDEFHELLCQEPLFAAFIRLMWTRVFSTSSKTILLSATPMNLDCFRFQDKIYYETNTPILNGEMRVNISFKDVDVNNIFEIDEKDSFIITNTVDQAKNIFNNLQDENALLIHSYFTRDDRCKIEQNIYNYHDKFSTVLERNTVVGTNIIGVGLDVSAHNIYDFVLSPENTIQRGCGRGGRFNEENYNGIINYIVCITKGKNKLVNEIFTKELQNKWIEMLSLYKGKSVTKKDLYDLYYEFYDKFKKDVNLMYLKFFKEGNKKLFDIMPHKTKKKLNSNVEVTSNTISYRGQGDNVFVIAKDENDKWSDPIIVPKYFIDDEAATHYIDGDNIMYQTIHNFIESNSKFTYDKITTKSNYGRKINKYMLKYYYGFDDRKGNYTKDNIIKLANRSDSPLPLFDYVYNSITGLSRIE